eukprot:snap_masked-scaffold_55-processed-gene-1.18-mRNA-1 protein AED:1.00 eAED:1.00 QI:0/0/0/0/1/1/2/0/145
MSLTLNTCRDRVETGFEERCCISCCTQTFPDRLSRNQCIDGCDRACTTSDPCRYFAFHFVFGISASIDDINKCCVIHPEDSDDFYLVPLGDVDNCASIPVTALDPTSSPTMNPTVLPTQFPTEPNPLLSSYEKGVLLLYLVRKRN